MQTERGIGWLNYGTVRRNDGWGEPDHPAAADGTRGIPIADALCELFPTIERPPDHFYFPQGACFAATRQSIIQHGRAFFEQMMKMGYEGWSIKSTNWKRAITWRENPAGLDGHWEMGLVYERLWAFIFCADLSRTVPWVFWAINEGIE